MKKIVKREIDRLPNELPGKVQKYLPGLHAKKVTKRRLHTFRLKGQFDDINIRERAYEKNSGRYKCTHLLNR